MVGAFGGIRRLGILIAAWAIKVEGVRNQTQAETLKR
jgi:hypothetical protein